MDPMTSSLRYLSVITRLTPVVLLGLVGCYAPMKSPGVPAASLPDHYRMPMRTASEPLNFGQLVASPPGQYLLGPGDQLNVLIPDLDDEQHTQSLNVIVQENGVISLPRAGVLPIGNLTVLQAQERVNQHLVTQNVLQNPRATLSLISRGTIKVMVLGEVREPGVYELPRHENDIAHAISVAGGFTDQADDLIEVHRKFHHSTASQFPTQAPQWGIPAPRNLAPQPVLPGVPINQVNYERPARGRYHSSQTASYSLQPTPPVRRTGHHYAPRVSQPSPQFPAYGPHIATAPPIERIPLRGATGWMLTEQQRLLNSGDVVKIPTRKAEVFYVVGPLSEINRVRFNVGDRDREIGNGFLLPKDREMDVITAVAMAGYIDPINSPTTVTLHRTEPDGQTLLIRVDLIAARHNPAENVLVHPGDIIYLNPDASWWWRRTFNGAINTVLGRVIRSN